MPVVERCEWPSWRWIIGSGIVQQLDGVGMPQLVRSYTPANACLDRGAMELQPGGAL